MPSKICPKCKKEVGPRTKVCPKCSHNFTQPTPSSSVSIKKTQKTKRVKQPKQPPEVILGDGYWTQDIEKGMPKVHYPNTILQNMSIEDVRLNIEYHGLGFCLYNYIYPENIKDKKLAKMWKNTVEQMREIVRYVYEKEI